MPQQPQETVTTEMAIPHEIDSHHMLPPSRQPGMNVGECGKGLNDRERTDKRSCRINYITPRSSAAYFVRVLRENGVDSDRAKGAQSKLSAAVPC